MIIDPHHYRKIGPLKGLYLLTCKIIRFLFLDLALPGRKKRKGKASSLLAQRWPMLVKQKGEGHRCISCHLCEKFCPSACLHVEASGPHQAPEFFSLEISKCISCGICVSVCPVEALKMEHLKGPLMGPLLNPFGKMDLIDLAELNIK